MKNSVPPIKDIVDYGNVQLILPEQGGLTKEVHLAEYDDDRYILRMCNGDANRLARYCKSLSKTGFLPRFLEQDRENLLFEYIEGRDCDYQDQNIAHQVGRISGLTSTIIPPKQIDFESRFKTKLDYLTTQDVIDKRTKRKLLRKYRDCRPNKIETSVEVHDTIPGNFRISEGGVYLVDIDGIGESLKGMTLAKSFLKWFTESDSREDFLKGYRSAADSSFLTEDYLQFIYLTYLVNKSFQWHNQGKNIEKLLKQMHESINGKLK